MECLVLAPTAAQGRALQLHLENLGPQWRCVPLRQTDQAVALLRTAWFDLAVLCAGEQADALVDVLHTAPLLSPPRLLGVDFAAPDGMLPAPEAVPTLLAACRREGRLPALAGLMLPRVRPLAEGMLRAIGVPTNLGAWEFLPDMAALTAVHPPLTTDLQHGLYPLIGMRHGLTPGAVERRLRLCVEATWNRGSLAALERFFGSSVDPERGKPTNREFLCRIQERLILSARRVVRG